MKVFVILIAAVAVVSGSVRVVRQSGWSTPGWTTFPPTTEGWTTPPPTTTGWPSTTTQGWSTSPSSQGWSTSPPTEGWSTSPPTEGWSTSPPTQGWSTSPPTEGWSTSPPTEGWSQPSTAGWGSASGVLTNVEVSGSLASSGSGWAAENHTEHIEVIGGGWNGPPADIVISSSGQSVVSQGGGVLQLTDQDNETAASINNVAVSQIAEAFESEQVEASGLEISNAQSGWAAAAGQGASAAEAASSLTVSQIADNLGLAMP